MEPIAAQRYNESQRMEIRTLVRLASEAISYYWPMRTFVHHNPLHGLEDMPFDEGVSKGRQLLGGRGYLANEVFREYFKTGRILARHLDAALAPREEKRALKLGARDITHAEVLRARIVGNVPVPASDAFERVVGRHPDRAAIAALAEILRKAIPPAVCHS